MVSLCPQIEWRGKQLTINDRTYICTMYSIRRNVFFSRIQLIWYLHDWHFGRRQNRRRKFLWLELQEVKSFSTSIGLNSENKSLFLDSKQQLWFACSNCVYDSWWTMSQNAHVDRQTKRVVKRRKQKKRLHTKTTKRAEKTDFNRYAMTKCWKVWGVQAWPDEKHLSFMQNQLEFIEIYV